MCLFNPPVNSCVLLIFPLAHWKGQTQQQVFQLNRLLLRFHGLRSIDLWCEDVPFQRVLWKFDANNYDSDYVENNLMHYRYAREVIIFTSVIINIFIFCVTTPLSTNIVINACYSLFCRRNRYFLHLASSLSSSPKTSSMKYYLYVYLCFFTVTKGARLFCHRIML